MIWERMEALGLADELLEVESPKNWSTSRDGGVRRIVREHGKKIAAAADHSQRVKAGRPP